MKKNIFPKLIRISTVPIFLNIIYKGQLKFLQNHFNVICISKYDDKHTNEIMNREGARMLIVDFNRTISPFKDFLCLLKMIFFFIKERPKIVHTHTPKAGLIGMVAAKVTFVPIRIHTVEGLPFVEAKGFRRSVLTFFERFTAACSNLVLSNSFGLSEIILKNDICPKNKLKVLAYGSSNGINLDFFNPGVIEGYNSSRNRLREKLGIQEDDFLFCFVGRLGIEKGIRELIDVFRNFRQSKKHIKLLLVGPYEEITGKLDAISIKEIENSENMVYVGRHDDIRPYLLASDGFVFPSYREGFPNSVLEAGAMGLPCIVTDINGCNEIIKDGLNGIVIPPKDPEALKKAMLRMVENTEERGIFVKNARISIVEKFHREILWEALLEEYNQLLRKTENR